jgi:hypothetical protein
MKYACNYAIIRFIPFVETGEFANIGVVLFCPEAKFFDFKLMSKGKKLTAFFEPLDDKIYKSAKKDFEKTLVTFTEMMRHTFEQNVEQTQLLFGELVRPREVLIRFDTPRAVLTDNLGKTLEQLFDFYVGKDFVTPDYAEKALEDRLTLFLTEAHLKSQYKTANIIGGAFKAKFPFAHKDKDGNVIKAIKPLHLGHHDPSKAHAHGWAWVGKLQQLGKHGVLPREVLVAAQRSEQNDSTTQEIFEEIGESFTKIGVKFSDVADTGKLREFAVIH